MSPLSWRREALRLAVVAAALGVAAVPGGTPCPADVSIAAASPATTETLSVGRRGWSLRANGWYIRVDGAEVDIPSLTEQTQPGAPRVAAGGPQSLSPYDRLIVRHARAQGLDWRLVAALIYEESRFVPDAVSDKGAYGLMQVRPVAAASVGSEHFKAPADNIRTGARYLKQLSEMFDDAQGRDHLALVLAAYNMGPGHLRDAQQLARRFRYDPDVWHGSMDLVLPLLEQMPYCDTRRDVLPNGCAQGSATVAYVNRVLERYDAYRRRFSATRGDLDESGASSGDVAQAASANG